MSAARQKQGSTGAAGPLSFHMFDLAAADIPRRPPRLGDRVADRHAPEAVHPFGGVLLGEIPKLTPANRPAVRLAWP